MTTTETFVTRHAVATYFVLTFLISWGGLLVVLGPGAFTGVTAPTEELLPLVYLAMFSGPSVAGILMKGLVDGKAGFHDLRSRLLKWRVDVRWYVVALLTAPLVMMAVLLPLSLGSAGFLPGVFASGDKVSLLVIGLAAGLMTGLCEELGWTGFVIFRFEEVSLLSAGSDYASEWIMTGTNDREVQGVPATGRSFRVRGASVGKLDTSGRIVENRDYYNLAEMFAQLGIQPPAPPQPA
jgi:hypothetical protein